MNYTRPEILPNCFGDGLYPVGFTPMRFAGYTDFVNPIPGKIKEEHSMRTLPKPMCQEDPAPGLMEVFERSFERLHSLNLTPVSDYLAEAEAIRHSKVTIVTEDTVVPTLQVDEPDNSYPSWGSPEDVIEAARERRGTYLSTCQSTPITDSPTCQANVTTDRDPVFVFYEARYHSDNAELNTHSYTLTYTASELKQTFGNRKVDYISHPGLRATVVTEQVGSVTNDNIGAIFRRCPNGDLTIEFTFKSKAPVFEPEVFCTVSCETKVVVRKNKTVRVEILAVKIQGQSNGRY